MNTWMCSFSVPVLFDCSVVLSLGIRTDRERTGHSALPVLEPCAVIPNFPFQCQYLIFRCSLDYSVYVRARIPSQTWIVVRAMGRTEWEMAEISRSTFVCSFDERICQEMRN